MNIVGSSPKRSFAVLFFLILILILLVIMPHHVAPYYTWIVTSIFMYTALTVSWATFSGPTGYISLASAGFVGAGMYVTVVLGGKLPLPLIIMFGGLTSLLLAVLVGLSSLRLKGIFFAVFTLGLSEALKYLVSWGEFHIGGSWGTFVIPLDYITCFYIMLIIMIMTLLTSYVIRRSKFGLGLRSIGQEEEAANHVGINTNATKIITFAITSFWMGAVGATMATQLTYINSDIAFDVLYSFTPVLMALVGGIGQIYGWVLGSVLLTIVAELLTTQFPYFYSLIFAVLIISTLLFFPTGLIGIVTKWQKGNLVN